MPLDPPRVSGFHSISPPSHVSPPPPPIQNNILRHCDYSSPIYFLSTTGIFIEHLKNNTTLRRLDLNGCGLNSLSAKNLAEALSTNKYLEELNISSNELGNDGIRHLARALSVNQCLKKLKLQECSINFLSESFAKALAMNEHLEDLNFSNNSLCDYGIQHLVHALRVNRGLKILNLTTCNLTSQSAKRLAEALTINKHLKRLNIGSNPIYSEGIRCLAHALGINQSLKILDLQSTCSLTSRSAKSLAKALTTNTHLEELNISDNALCDDGIQHLAHALKVNQHLKTLLLVNCSIADNGFQCLAEAIQYNHGLNTLFVHNRIFSKISNLISETIVPVLIECLQNNCTLTKLWLPYKLKSSMSDIEEAVNDVRKRSGLPLIEIMVL